MPLLPLELPPAGELALALELPEGTCELAPAERADAGLQVTAVGSAVADWAATQGRLVAAPAGAFAACAGGPRPTAVPVPSGGWAIGLTRAPVDIRADGVALARVRPLGDDRSWWHVPPVAGQLAFVFGEGLPPALFTLVPEPDVLPPAGWSVELPQGEAREAPAEATPIAAAVEPPGAVRVVGWGDRVVVVGVLPGTADGQLREGAAAPHALHATVLRSTRPPLAVVLRPGRSRRVPIDGPAAADALALDPDVATVAVDHGRLRIRAGAEGGLGTVLVRGRDGSLWVLSVVVSGR